jgi:hypothetical protein
MTFMMHSTSGRDGFDSLQESTQAQVAFGMAAVTSGRNGAFGTTQPPVAMFGMAAVTSGRNGAFDTLGSPFGTGAPASVFSFSESNNTCSRGKTT